MNTVDIIIAVVLIGALVNGFRQGAAMQVLSFGGFWAGLGIGAALAPFAARAVGSPLSRAATSLLVTFGAAMILSTVGRMLGTRVWGFLKRKRLGAVDSGLGAAIAFVATGLIVWLTATVVATLPLPGVVRAVHDSVAVQTLTKQLPPAPAIFARLSPLFSVAGFPRVFTGLERDPSAKVSPPTDPQFKAAVTAGRTSTVRIVGTGCGGIQTGSGFVVSPGLVITNAHVVAGIDRPVVQDAKGSHQTTSVYFDPNLDIAILKTSGLAGKPLALLAGSAPRSQTGAVLGFPGGGDFTAVGAAVMDEFDAIGRDIYGERVTSRHVYQLQAKVHPGNSGGPFITPKGQVAGVIFSRSVAREDVSYSITTDQLTGPLQQAQQGKRADTGPCAN
ncbi:MAG: MarP family serine protease [Actinomycetota bacterium]